MSTAGAVYYDTEMIDKGCWNIAKGYTITQEQAEDAYSYMESYAEKINTTWKVKTAPNLQWMSWSILALEASQSHINGRFPLHATGYTPVGAGEDIKSLENISFCHINP